MALQTYETVPVKTPMRFLGIRGQLDQHRSGYDHYFAHAPATMELSSPAFADGQTIPAKYTGAENVSPPLLWKHTPAGTRSLTIIVEDVDSKGPRPAVHWLMYNIFHEETNLPEGILPEEQVRAYGLVHGRNSQFHLGYFGFAPSKGSPLHRYHFQIFALNIILPLYPGKGRTTVFKAMNDHVLAKGRLIGSC